MATRLGRIVGIASIVLVVARLGRVLDIGDNATDWRLIAVAAALGGALVTWIALTYGTGRWRLVVAHLAGLALLIARVAAPSTFSFGIIPGPETTRMVGSELGQALDLLRFGSPPVLALAGLTALVAAAMWMLASAWMWGAVTARPWLGIVPPLGFYLYLAVVDRAPALPAWSAIFVMLTALGLLSTSQVIRPGAGRVRDADDRPVPRRQLGASAVTVLAVMAAGLVGATLAGPALSGTGAIRWRNGSSGDGTGSGVSFNRFVGLRQDLVSQSDEPVFVATIEGETPVSGGLYWKLVTLDHYDGSFWVPAETTFADPTDSAWEDPNLAYRGDTTTVSQTVRIESLREDRLPVLYSPTSVASASDIIRAGAQAGSDGSLRINAISRQGLTYKVESRVPTIDVAALATNNGQLSPLFAEAAAEGLFTADAAQRTTADAPLAIDPYLDLPDDLDPAIGDLAREITAGVATPFERALLLEDFLRGFTYDLDVSSGHTSLQLAAWLTDPESLNYRRGYCEQFATAMGVMGRALGLPTRVVIGFTPGERLDTPDGPVTVVRQRNAHAWVEVWLDAEGWVRFDPTPRSDGATIPTSASIGFDPGVVDLSVAANDTPEAQPPNLVGDIPNIPAFDFGGSSTSGVSGSDEALWWVWGSVAALILLVGAIPASKLIRRRSRHKLALEGDITAAWAEITDRLTDLGSGPSAHQTPIEFASATDPALTELANAYSASIYGGESVPDASERLSGVEDWILRAYDGRDRTKAAFNLRSLVRR